MSFLNADASLNELFVGGFGQSVVELFAAKGGSFECRIPGESVLLFLAGR